MLLFDFDFYWIHHLTLWQRENWFLFIWRGKQGLFWSLMTAVLRMAVWIIFYRLIAQLLKCRPETFLSDLWILRGGGDMSWRRMKNWKKKSVWERSGGAVNGTEEKDTACSQSLWTDSPLCLGWASELSGYLLPNADWKFNTGGFSYDGFCRAWPGFSEGSYDETGFVSKKTVRSVFKENRRNFMKNPMQALLCPV